MVTLYSKPRYILSFFFNFPRISWNMEENDGIRTSEVLNHTLASYPSNCTTIQYYLPDAQNQTYPYYTITNHGWWQELTPTWAHISLPNTLPPSIWVACIFRKINMEFSFFLNRQETRYHYIKKKKEAEFSLSTKSLKSFFDAELFCVEAHENVEA